MGIQVAKTEVIFQCLGKQHFSHFCLCCQLGCGQIKRKEMQLVLKQQQFLVIWGSYLG